MMGLTSTELVKLVASCRMHRSPLAQTVVLARLICCAQRLDFSGRPEQPIIAKGNAGIPKYVDGHIHYDGTPELMADYACLARDSGATIIGGCCGTTPEHLKAMRAALETRPKGGAPTLEAITEAMGAFSSESDGTDGAGPVRAPRRGRRRS